MSLNRRNFLVVLGASAGIMALGSCKSKDLRQEAIPQTPTPTPSSQPKVDQQAMTIQLPPLPYDYKALEPHIDARTMQLHHDKHHAAYVKNLNDAVAKYPQLKGKSAEALLRQINSVPQDVRQTIRNNGGGHVNHSMFWQIMSPKGGGEPTGAIADAIKKTFGSVAAFKQQFNEVGTKHFGSGWVWLVRTKDGKLKIISTLNQDSPLMQGNYPIMGNDLWEHAYYLNYQNRRADYLKAWWNVVNWNEINNRFAKKG